MSRMPDAWRWLLPVLAFLVVELVALDRLVSRTHAWVYPRWNDQIQYLTEAYIYHEHAREHGLGAGMWAAATKASAQGLLHAPAAVALFSVAGPSRSAALFLNLLAFAAFQAALVLALRKSFGVPAAWLGLGLSLFWLTLSSGGPGSAIDFRLDFLGSCLFGVSLCALVCSRGLDSLRWCLAFGIAVGLTLLARFLTGTYFVVIFLVLAAWAIASRDRWRRLGRLAAAAGLAALVAAPFFWMNRQWIYDYYYIGHYVGPESAIRNQHMGIWRSLGFLLDALRTWHLSPPALHAWAGAMGIFVAGAWIRPRPTGDGRLALANWLVPALAFIAAPVLVLTLHSQKSFVVVSVLAPGLILLGAALLAIAMSRTSKSLGWAVAVLLVAGGTLHVGAGLRGSSPTNEARDDARRVNAVADLVFRLSRLSKLDTPRVGVDLVTDALDAQVMRVLCYERHRRWVPFVMTLPTSIARDDPAVLQQRLAQSDFMFVATEDPLPGAFPYDQQMQELRPQHLQWCRSHLEVIDEFTLAGRRWTLFASTAVAKAASPDGADAR